MKLAKSIWIRLALGAALLAIASVAEANDDLTYDGACALPAKQVVALNGDSVFVEAKGLTCEDLKFYGEAIKMVKAAILPATTAILLAPELKESLVAELAALGLTYANPAVLGVTVIGAAGVSVFYIVLQKKISDCEAMDRQQLKEQIEAEILRKYGLPSSPQFRVEVGG